MKNIEMKIDGNKMILTVDLDKEFGRSKSGQTIIIASSEGNKSIPGFEDARFGINVYKYPESR